MYPSGLEKHPRDNLMAVQGKIPADRGGFGDHLRADLRGREAAAAQSAAPSPDPDRRVFINTDVCEGCGDCGGAVELRVDRAGRDGTGPRKRAIDQSSCNKDFSCLKGFCPSFVTLEGREDPQAGDGGGGPVGPARPGSARDRGHP